MILKTNKLRYSGHLEFYSFEKDITVYVYGMQNIVFQNNISQNGCRFDKKLKQVDKGQIASVKR